MIYFWGILVKEVKAHHSYFNPIALSNAKIVYNFGLSECNRVKIYSDIPLLLLFFFFFGGGGGGGGGGKLTVFWIWLV